MWGTKNVSWLSSWCTKMARGCLLLVWSVALFIFASLILCKAVPRERTLAMVKPDGVRANHTDAIKSIIELAGFDITKQKSLQLDTMTAQVFYYEHFRKPFFDDLISFMTSGPILAMVLEQDNAVAKWRVLIGPTDPKKAQIEEPNSVRAIYGSSTTQNCVHGSDSIAAANREIMILFGDVQADNGEEIRHEEL